MIRHGWLTVFALTALFLSAGVARSDEKIPLNVLYLARSDAPDRTDAFVELFSQRFRECKQAQREHFTADLLQGTDVVVLDWSQDERHGSKLESPVGPLEEWSTPTVLLGSAGLLMAGAWHVIGDAG